MGAADGLEPEAAQPRQGASLVRHRGRLPDDWVTSHRRKEAMQRRIIISSSGRKVDYMEEKKYNHTSSSSQNEERSHGRKTRHTTDAELGEGSLMRYG